MDYSLLLGIEIMRDITLVDHDSINIDSYNNEGLQNRFEGQSVRYRTSLNSESAIGLNKFENSNLRATEIPLVAHDDKLMMENSQSDLSRYSFTRITEKISDMG